MSIDGKFINFIGSHIPRHVSHSMSHVTTKQCCNHFGGYSKHTVKAKCSHSFSHKRLENRRRDDSTVVAIVKHLGLV